jgi:hypothetical protein
MTITPEFVHDLESIIKAAVVEDYDTLTSDLWWQKVASRTATQARVERIAWLLSTAKIERPNASHGGGQALFDELVATYMEYEVESATAGLRITEDQADDVFGGIPGGEAFKIADRWARDVTKYAAYWPQEEVAKAILANPVTYDQKAFFAVDHPVNPFDAGAGIFANRFTGAAAGSYPGALPIGGTLATAIENIGKAIAYIGDIKMPSGTAPRRLKVGGLIVPPRLAMRAVELTQAKFIAKDNGSQDVEGVVRYMNLGQPIVASELGAAFGGSDTSCYLAVQELTSGDIGAFNYVERSPFSMTMHSSATSAELARMEELQYKLKGRNIVAPGHPYKLFRLEAT